MTHEEVAAGRGRQRRCRTTCRRRRGASCHRQLRYHPRPAPPCAAGRVPRRARAARPRARRRGASGGTSPGTSPSHPSRRGRRPTTCSGPRRSSCDGSTTPPSGSSLPRTARGARRWPTPTAAGASTAVSVGDTVICHNDVCPENVVFRGGVAVALLDFDFAAPGTRLHDLARLALMTVPIDTPEDAARTGRGGLDPFTRLRVVADAYGLARDRVRARGRRRAQCRPRRAHSSSAGSTEARRPSSPCATPWAGWSAMTGDRAWFMAHRQRFLDAVG